ncbi:MAG TPA: GAF domain-containing protein [Gemmatimonadales bacterium]|nr:GAF domain-containing protein [Gemmatimonadales bacterium]
MDLHTTVDAAIFTALAVVIGVLLWRLSGTRTQLRVDLERLERQNEIGRVLLTDRNVRGVTRHVAETAARLLGSDMGHITLTTEDPHRLVLEAATGPLAPSIGAAVPVQGTMAGWVIRKVQPLVLNDPSSAPEPFVPLHERIPIRRAVMLPLVARGRCVGALGVDNPRGAQPIRPEDVEILKDLAEYAALTIEVIQAVEELQDRERRAALLNQINSRIRQSLDLQVILETAVRELGVSLEASRCFVRLRRGSELLPPAAEWHSPQTSPLGNRPDPANALVHQAYNERRTVETSDAREHPLTAREAGSQSQALAVLCAPIVLRGEAIGVITFHQVGLPRLWRVGDIGLVEEVAAELAIAISNARLYRSVEEASRELAHKISELERANRMKAQFLANMSHELRTPLNSVIGFSEMLLLGAHGRLTDDQRDALETIARNGRHLLGLVNDVLDLSKVEAGRMELHLSTTDIRRLIPDVLAGMESLVTAKGHNIRLELSDAPLLITADEMRVRQILFNLLSNAIKFTPPHGDITIRAARRRSVLPLGSDLSSERDAVWVAVVDNGIGISKEDQAKLFTEFSQVDASYARRHEGTGLGLALCRKLMDLHGGRIGVESRVGEGSTFWVEFPVDGPKVQAA